MPAIRDYSFAYETVTTDAGITIPTPTNSLNDLLVAFVMGDTGTPTWTPPLGFTTAFALNNTVSTFCAWKISNGSEPTSFTFNATVSETYNGSIVSIRDVDTTNPFGSPGITSAITQASAAKFNMHQITTNVNNALVLAFSANSVAGVPSFIENKGMSVLAADGAAESMGIGWFFMPTTGTLTPSNISCSNVASGAGVKALVQIAPPSGGATVIPTYIASDSSVYLEPINGTTAYNGNTALAATADTNFGTSLGGFTAADATVGAAADTGLNSFHSTGQLTTVANATNIYGAELIFSVGNRPNITGKNLLCHVQASTPTQLQRVPKISSNRGIWMGVRSSNAANWKIWQVMGADAPFAANRPIPIIINELAGNTVSTNGTLVPSSILAVGFWAGSLAVGTGVWQFGSLWQMDKTIVGGGNTSEPMTLDQIVFTVADSHERKSAILQGKNQALFLQHIQIGDGGTHPVYLNLDSSAIEFPSQYNSSTRLVNYNSTDSVIGLQYEPGPTDTIKHTNSIISSPNRYFWGLTSAASSSASYNFSGLSVIGVGTVGLAHTISINELTINDFSSINVSNANLTNCNIIKPPSINDSITSNSSTLFSGCDFNVVGVALSNSVMSVSNPSIFSNCNFTGGTTSGHAIRLTTPGTYSFNDNTFVGFGTTGNSAIFNDSGGGVTLNVNGGTVPTVRNGVGAITTISATVQVNLNGLPNTVGLANSTEIRIYDRSQINPTLGITTTEFPGIGTENHTTSSYSFNVGLGATFDVKVLNLDYVPFVLSNQSAATNPTNIEISLKQDRVYRDLTPPSG